MIARLKEFASVPTNFADSHIVVDASVDDETAKFLVDTGAGSSMLDSAFVARRNLPVIETGTLGHGLTGRGLSGLTRVDSLRIGKAVSRNSAFAIGHIGGDGRNGQPVGLFAADYLANYDVEIDSAAGRLNLFSQDHCPGEVVYWAKEYFRLPVSLTPDKRLDVQIEIDGKTLRGMIDTGAGATLMRLAVARRLFGIDPDAAGVPHGLITGADAAKLDAFPHVFKSLSFGGITLHNTTVIVANVDSGNAGTRGIANDEQEDVIIGMPLLRQLHLFIAYSEPALYFTVAEPTRRRVKRPPPDRAGSEAGRRRLWPATSPGSARRPPSPASGNSGC
ncbi:MAG: retroviral-like aspartic protease family protein [Aliidongia sp.]